MSTEPNTSVSIRGSVDVDKAIGLVITVSRRPGRGGLAQPVAGRVVGVGGHVPPLVLLYPGSLW